MVTFIRGAMRKTRLALFPLIARFTAPGPRIFRFLVTASSPPVSVIVAGTGSANVIVSPLRELLMAARNDPAPLSAALVTVRVAACDMAGAAASIARNVRTADVKVSGLAFISLTGPCEIRRRNLSPGKKLVAQRVRPAVPQCFRPACAGNVRPDGPARESHHQTASGQMALRMGQRRMSS